MKGSTDGVDSAQREYDVGAIGETMVSFVGRESSEQYLAIPAGAESNVAVGVVSLGCRPRWVSRLGNDPLGRFVEQSIANHGVDVAVTWDETHPTGVMTKHLRGSASRKQYYRSESAARHLSERYLQRTGQARWPHLTGITAVLSPSAAQLVEAAVDRRTAHHGRVAFDFNLRLALWPDAATAARTRLTLARRADVVFIGNDEAATLLGTEDLGALGSRVLRRDGQELVLKRGPGSAWVVTGDREVSEPALSVEVIDPTGAGDAFAAGYLARCSRGWPARARLRLGHLMASRAAGVLEDIPPPLAPAELEALSPEALALSRGSEAEKP